MTLILYGSTRKLSGSHKLVTVPGHPKSKQPPYYVRVAVSKSDILDALNKARPRVGETVLNTVGV